MHEKIFSCKQCGWCCKDVVINIAYSDIKRWEKEEQYDILKEVVFLANYPKDGVGGFYFHKTVLNPKQQCPFYDTSCLIYNTRPLACRDYPLASSKPEGCPAYVKQSNSLVKKIKYRQTKDFKRANKHIDSLLSILEKARVLNSG